MTGFSGEILPLQGTPYYSGSCEAITTVVAVPGAIPDVQLAQPLNALPLVDKQELSSGLKLFVVKSLVCSNGALVWDTATSCSVDDAGLSDLVQITTPPDLADENPDPASAVGQGRRLQDASESSLTFTVQYTVTVPETGIRTYADRAQQLNSGALPIVEFTVQIGDEFINLDSSSNMAAPVLDAISWEMYSQDIPNAGSALSGFNPTLQYTMNTQLLFLEIGAAGTVTFRTCNSNAPLTELTLWEPADNGLSTPEVSTAPPRAFSFADFNVDTDISGVSGQAGGEVQACPPTDLPSTGPHCCGQRAVLRVELQPGMHCEFVPPGSLPQPL